MKDVKFEVIKKLVDTRFKYRELGKISRLDSISPPSVFIGSKLKYPLVNIGILSPLDKDENAWIYDDEKYWAENNFQVGEVLKLRDSLLNSRFKSNVKAVNSLQGKKFVQIAQKIAVAYKPVDVEIELNKSLNFKNKRDKILTPHGLRASLKKAKVVGNVKVHKKVDKVINDDIKASEALKFLYKNDFSEYSLNKILSVGVLGLKKNRRFVPTRWSITATDDMIAKDLLKQVKDYKILENYELYFGEFLGNQYMIFLIPEIWSYELFELYLPKSSWNPSSEIKASTDYENFYGRKKYAFATAGGYYATRLPILEFLNQRKRQASILVVRIETPGYWAGLGVWVVRESVRKSLNNKGFVFRDLNELLNSGKQIGKNKFDFDYSEILNQSKLLKNIKTQRNLLSWMR